MRVNDIFSFIEALPVPRTPFMTGEERAVSGADIDALPDDIVNGSTLLAFEADVSKDLRTSVALCLLAAQKIADTDSVVNSSSIWVQRHEMVLCGLNWFSSSGGTVFSEKLDTNVSVHDAIVPFLVAALGPAAGAASLIISAVNQLDKMDDSTPWITLFDRQSRRFDVLEYRFATANHARGTVVLRIGATRFIASRERIQIVFFKFNDVNVNLCVAIQILTANTNILKTMNCLLKEKIKDHITEFIQAPPFEA